MITFDQVSKKFPLGNIGLDKVSFTIKDNEFVFLVGPSGAGKTTIIKLIIRDFLPTSGAIFVDGENITEASFNQVVKLRRKIGVIFQDFKILIDKNVAENIALSMRVTNTPEKQINDQIEKVLNFVNLTDKKHFFPAQLSAGEIQRVAIARAISGNRKIILADEPTGNLDPKTSWEIMKIFKKLENKNTIIFATHNTDIVNSLQKRVILVRQGRIIKDSQKGSYEI